MLSWWTIGRATGAGLMAALSALLCWVAFASGQEAARIPFIAALTGTAFCGLSIMAITGYDLAMRQRGSRLLPVRTFDLVLAVALAAPALLALADLLG